MTISRDNLRIGTALVRALIVGDETARGPLSDWIEEYGLPGTAPRRFSFATAERSLRHLRLAQQPIRIPPYDREEGVIVYVGYDVWLGTWPSDVWEATEPHRSRNLE